MIFFIFGLFIGSFLNVVVWRLYSGEPIANDRSRCPQCKKIISWYDNVPLVSFIILQGKCRKCRNKISWQYPLVELVTGVLFAAVGWKFWGSDLSSYLEVVYLCAVVGILIVIAVYDAIHMEIPDNVLNSGIFLSVIHNLIFDWFSPASGIDIMQVRTYSGVLAATAGFLFFFSLVVVSKEKWMGWGDAYLAILLGLVLGWPNIIMALFLSFLFGSFYAIILLALKKYGWKDEIPFGPFLVLGTIVVIFFYEPILTWYWNLFSLR